MGLEGISFSNDSVVADGASSQVPMGLPFDPKLLGHLKHLLPGELENYSTNFAKMLLKIIWRSHNMMHTTNDAVCIFTKVRQM